MVKIWDLISGQSLMTLPTVPSDDLDLLSAPERDLLLAVGATIVAGFRLTTGRVSFCRCLEPYPGRDRRPGFDVWCPRQRLLAIAHTSHVSLHDVLVDGRECFRLMPDFSGFQESMIENMRLLPDGNRLLILARCLHKNRPTHRLILFDIDRNSRAANRNSGAADRRLYELPRPDHIRCTRLLPNEWSVEPPLSGDASYSIGFVQALPGGQALLAVVDQRRNLSPVLYRIPSSHDQSRPEVLGCLPVNVIPYAGPLPGLGPASFSILAAGCASVLDADDLGREFPAFAFANAHDGDYMIGDDRPLMKFREFSSEAARPLFLRNGPVPDIFLAVSRVYVNAYASHAGKMKHINNTHINATIDHLKTTFSW